MSLALGSLAATVINAALLMPLRPRSFPWLPGLRDVKRVMSFGGALTATMLLWTLARGAPELLLGKLQSLAAAGLYSRASGLVEIFHRLVTDAINGVALSWFAQEARQRGDFSQSFVKATGYVTAIGWTFCITIVCLAHPIISLLFGPQWLGAVDLARLLGAALAFAVPVALCFAALVAAGAVNKLLQATAASTAVLVVLAGPGAWLGLLYTGWANVLAAAFDTALFMWITHRAVGFHWASLRAELLKSGFVALGAGLGPGAALVAFGSRPEVITAPMLLGVIGGAVGFVAAAFVIRHPIREEVGRLFRRAGSRT
jgi:O-antigen/teichoic acid export membrane protein